MYVEPPALLTDDDLVAAAAELDTLLERACDLLSAVAKGLEARSESFVFPHPEATNLFETACSFAAAHDAVDNARADTSAAFDQIHGALEHDPECGYVYKDDDGEYHCYGGDHPDDHPDAYGETQALNVLVHDASNPFSVLDVRDTWGKVVIQFHGGAGACVACGDADATRRQIVPSHILRVDLSHSLVNHLPLCNSCAARWSNMPVEAHYLAAAMLLRGCPEGTESLSRNGQLGMAGADLHQRDGATCRVCGLTDPDPKTFHRGHIVSRHDARERKDGAVWGLPFVLSESPLNYVLMCPPCNVAIGPVSPNLRVGLRFLLKPWTSDPTAETIIAARRTTAMQRVAEFQAERLRRRLRDQ